MPDLYPLQEWTGEPGELVLWLPSAGTAARVSRAPASAVPPSHEQEQHLHAFHACALRNEPMARLVIVVWEMEGRCNLRLLDTVIHAHLRRHDTYHSWFEHRGDAIVRHVVDEPSELQLVPTAMGLATAAEWQGHIEATPGPFAWDCFRFGIVQRDEAFTVFACVDHVHADVSLVDVLMRELCRNYLALLNNEPITCATSVGRYLAYCDTQRRRSADLRVSDPGVSRWLDFMTDCGGRLPRFPLDLGLVESRSRAEHVKVNLLTAAEAAAFEQACVEAGARLVGGVIACAALTDREVAGVDRYRVVTPTSTRRGAAAMRMSGWCMGLVPVALDVAGLGFGQAARAAQRSFDDHRPLAATPIERVLELAASTPGVQPSAPGGVMLSFLDTERRPFSPQFSSDWHARNGRLFMNTGMAGQVALWFFRTHHGLSLTVGCPATDVARAAVARYVEVLRAQCRSAARR